MNVTLTQTLTSTERGRLRRWAAQHNRFAAQFSVSGMPATFVTLVRGGFRVVVARDLCEAAEHEACHTAVRAAMLAARGCR